MATATTGQQVGSADMLPANREEALKVIQRNFTSDTVTIPDDEMLRRMMLASVGDDMNRQDKATIDLEERVAKLAGKEAALFVLSELAIRSQLKQPPHSVIVDSRAHVYRWEAGGVAFHSQATIMPVIASNGRYITWEDIESSLVLEENIHYCPTKLICLENTLHGMIMPQEEVVRISQNAKERSILMHCDGARMWDVHAKTGKSLEELCAPFDTVSMCMSKGLGAPMGSLLVGTKELIAKARWFRQMFGGGMRQSGCIAAAADYALTRTLPLLPSVHEKAARLAQAFENLGTKMVLPVHTGILFVDTLPLGFTPADLTRRALQLDGGRAKIFLGGARIVVHFQITDEAIDDLIALVALMKEECSQGGLKGCDSASKQESAKQMYDLATLK